MKKTITLLITLCLVLVLAACSLSTAATSTQTSTSGSSAAQSGAAQTTGSQSGSNSQGAAATSTLDSTPQVNGETHESAADYAYDATAAVQVALNGDTITTQGQGVSVEGSTATITQAGVYSFSGSLTDGQIVVKTVSKETVWIILNGVDIHSSSSAPIYIADAKKVVIVLADQSLNTLTDAENYVYAIPADEEPNAAIYSKSDLTITGAGSLTVNANFNDGINSKDGLIIAGGTITVNAADDGIRGKDYLVMKDGSLTVNASGDGLKSDNEEDATLGYISIDAGSIQISAGGDAINAQTDVMVKGGTFALTTGGGSSKSISADVSAKGIKGVVSVCIDGGTFNIDAADDGIHSNGSVAINGGTYTIASADDGVHADATLTINNGQIEVTKSYEGLESAVITINDGNIKVTSSDDGVNVAGGKDSSGMTPGRGRPGQDNFSASTNQYLYIHGGTLFVDAQGDGFDVNGAIEMTGGVALVNGPTEQMNGPLDYDAGFNMTGGFLVATGSAGMAMVPNQGQNSVLIYLTNTQQGGTLVHIQNSAGEDVLTFMPTRNYQSIAFSSPQLAQGETYTVYTGGSSTGSQTGGLYQGGTYTAGNQTAQFTVSGTVTQVGSGGRMGGPGGGRRP